MGYDYTCEECEISFSMQGNNRKPIEYCPCCGEHGRVRDNRTNKKTTD